MERKKKGNDIRKRRTRRKLVLYDLGFSFFSFQRLKVILLAGVEKPSAWEKTYAERPTPETFTTLKRTPGISPLALPFRPKPASKTSSFSSTKFKQPSLGTIMKHHQHDHPIKQTTAPIWPTPSFIVQPSSYSISISLLTLPLYFKSPSLLQANKHNP